MNLSTSFSSHCRCLQRRDGVDASETKGPFDENSYRSSQRSDSAAERIEIDHHRSSHRRSFVTIQ